MINIIAAIFATVGLPLLINKTTEHRLRWLTPNRLRPSWMVVLVAFSLYLLHKESALKIASQLHDEWGNWGYLISAILGAILLCAYWWVTGRWFPSAPNSPVASVPSNDSGGIDDVKAEEQFGILNLPPEKKAELSRMMAPLFRHKAAVLDTPEYRKLIEARAKFRDERDSLERAHGCLIQIDEESIRCLPKPPAVLPENSSKAAIDIELKVVAEQPDKSRFWVVHNRQSKLRIPIVLFVSISNPSTTEPIKIDLVYLEAKVVGGWADIRMADALFPSASAMDDKPLILEGNNGSVSMSGDYLVPALYDRIIQPGTHIEGWIIAEFPKNIKYGDSLGEMRISLHADKQWIASKSFAASPNVYGKYKEGTNWKSFYFVPLETLVTEDE